MRKTAPTAVTTAPSLSTEPRKEDEGLHLADERRVAPAGADADASAAAVVQKPLRGSRAGSLWVGLLAAAVVVIALIVFIAQNSHQVDITFLGFHGHFSLALALLVATVGGILLVAIPGSLRIMQLRHAVKKNARVHA